MGEREQRHLPGDAAVPVRVPVELVHDHVVHGRVFALAQGDVGQHLRGAAEDGRVPVHGGVARGEPDVLGPSSRQRAIHFSLTRALIGLV